MASRASGGPAGRATGAAVAEVVQWFKRAERGLYGGKKIRFGNNVSHSERKTRRSWKPNVQRTTIRSDFLDQDVRMPITAHVLRCIRKAGGFDHYLVSTKDPLLRNPYAIDLKNMIKAAIKQGTYTLALHPNASPKPANESSDHLDRTPKSPLPQKEPPKTLWDAVAESSKS